MREVYIVVQTKTNPHREIIIAVYASQVRAERYIATESREGRQFRLVKQPLLP